MTEENVVSRNSMSQRRSEGEGAAVAGNVQVGTIQQGDKERRRVTQEHQLHNSSAHFHITGHATNSAILTCL
jgi:hypothetical protein